MESKEEITEYVRGLGASRAISKEELIKAYEEGGRVLSEQVLVKKLGIAEILYYIGGAIVFLGIVTFLSQNWSSLNASTKIFATLGSGIAAYFTGFFLGRSEKTEAVGSAFHLISALVNPIGLYVVFQSAGFDTQTSGFQSLLSSILLVVYLASYALFRKTIFILFAIIFGTGFFFAFTSFLAGGNPILNDLRFSEYRMFAAGLAYLLLGYFFSQGERAALSGFLYGFGLFGFLGAALALGGWTPNQSVFWELIFPGLVFGALFLSVQLKSNAFLVFGALFLMAYILKITAEYFSSGLGWPLALVVAGFSLIAIGYFSFYLKRTYIS